MSKKILFSVLVLSLMSFSLFKGEKKETKVLLSTEYGNIKIKLFNETPQPVSYTHLTLPTNREV